LWYTKTSEETFQTLNTSENGLTDVEAKSRLEKYGKNSLPEQKKDDVTKIFIKQFISPIIIILIAVTVLSFIINELTNAFFILAVIIINSVLGAYQEWNAEKSAKKLQNMIKVKTKVLRNGEQLEIDSEYLTLGDIVVLESGDKISADIRLIKTQNLMVDESILTGESLSVIKNTLIFKEQTAISECSNIAYAGTVVSSGRALGVVVEIGVNTEFGKIADKVMNTKETKSPLVIRIDKFVRQIGQFFAIFAVIVAFFLFYKGYMIQEIFFLVISLTVSAIPEGLSVAVTVALSRSSHRMAKENVIVKKLYSVESLGSCTVIASDKTGTLTLNEQTAKKILLPCGDKFYVNGAGYNDEGTILSDDDNTSSDVTSVHHIVKLGVLNNEASLKKDNQCWIKHGDSIDVAFLALGYKVGMSKDSLQSSEIVGAIPYESQEKYSAVFFEENHVVHCAVKGSPEKILDFCDGMIIGDKIRPVDKQLILNQNEELAKEGFRVIAVATGINEGFVRKDTYGLNDVPKLVFMGLIGFVDPIRDDIIDAIQTCKKAGIKTVMITGDHPLTAYSVAKKLNMLTNYGEVVTGDILQEYSNRGIEELDKKISITKVFARVTPLQKLEIVESFKRQGEFVAVTGDGVNDSPALKAANIGIAMGSGTDVAKETGNMIISDDNFSSIVKGVKEGRIAYSNVRNVINLLLSTGLSEIILFLLAIVFSLDVPLIAVQLLWLNFITNGIQDVALAFEKGEDWVMQQKPRSPKERIFNKLLIQELLLAAVTIGIIAFSVYYYLINYAGVDIVQARTYVLLLMVFLENIHILNCRSELTSFLKVRIRNNLFVLISLTICVLVQIGIVLTPNMLGTVLSLEVLSVGKILLMFLCTIPLLIIMEIFKKVKRKRSEGYT